MPRVTMLVGHHIQAVKGQEPDTQDGEPAVVDTWTLLLTDTQTHDQIRCAFRRDVRDELVRQLTGGIVLAGGELPRLP